MCRQILNLRIIERVQFLQIKFLVVSHPINYSLNIKTRQSGGTVSYPQKLKNTSLGYTYLKSIPDDLGTKK